MSDSRWQSYSSCSPKQTGNLQPVAEKKCDGEKYQVKQLKKRMKDGEKRNKKNNETARDRVCHNNNNNTAVTVSVTPRVSTQQQWLWQHSQCNRELRPTTRPSVPVVPFEGPPLYSHRRLWEQAGWVNHQVVVTGEKETDIIWPLPLTWLFPAVSQLKVKGCKSVTRFYDLVLSQCSSLSATHRGLRCLGFFLIYFIFQAQTGFYFNAANIKFRI